MPRGADEETTITTQAAASVLRRRRPRAVAPADPQRDEKRRARIQQRIDQAEQRLTDELATLADDQAFRRFLAAFARYRRYSAFNALLIRAQMPTASVVQAEGAWRKLGRERKTGEKPIRILAPRSFMRDVRDPDTDEVIEKKRVVLPGHFTTVNVYDVSQTEGAPITPPPAPVPLSGEDAETGQLIQHLRGWLSQRATATHGEDGAQWSAYDQERGYRRDQDEYVIDQRLDRNQRALVLSRIGAERALDELSERQRAALTREDRRLVIEGAAYVACSAYALDATQATFPDLSLLADDRPRTERVVRAIEKTARALLETAS